MDIEGIIFDLDGTLINSIGDIANSMNAVLSSHGFKTHTHNKYKQFIGRGIENLVIDALPEENRKNPAKYIQEMRDEYAVQYDSTTEVYEGIHGLIRYLKGKNKKLSILSNKPDVYTQEIVRKYFDVKDFAIILGWRKEFERKPDPKSALFIAEKMNIRPSRIAFIGDSTTDIITAKNAGMHPVGVSWGYKDVSDIKDAGATCIFEQPMSITSLFE